MGAWLTVKASSSTAPLTSAIGLAIGVMHWSRLHRPRWARRRGPLQRHRRWPSVRRTPCTHFRPTGLLRGWWARARVRQLLPRYCRRPGSGRARERQQAPRGAVRRSTSTKRLLMIDGRAVEPPQLSTSPKRAHGKKQMGPVCLMSLGLTQIARTINTCLKTIGAVERSPPSQQDS